MNCAQENKFKMQISSCNLRLGLNFLTALLLPCNIHKQKGNHVPIVLMVFIVILLQTIPSLSEQHLSMSQKPTFSQQSNAKIAPDTQHNDLTQHFVANGSSNAQFAQPLFIPTSSGLILTAALPTMLTSQITNLQPISQQPMATALHQVTDKSSIAVSIDKRPCINMQIPQQALAVTLPSDNNIQSNFLPNNFAFGVNAPATVPMNQTIVSDKGPTTFNRPNLLSSVTIAQPFTQQKIATTSTNTLSLPVTFSLSAPPPLCVQSKEMVQPNNHLNLSNSQISFATSNSTTMTASQLTNHVTNDFLGNKVYFKDCLTCT